MESIESVARNARSALRNLDARYIVDGACNPVAICGTIHKHMLKMMHDGADHPAIKADPAIRLMLDHLCQVMGGFGGMDDGCGDGQSDWAKCYRAIGGTPYCDKRP